MVRVAVRDAHRPATVVGYMTVREIVVKVKRKQGPAEKVRLWTSLDARKAPARELALLYTKRWEHELYYRELKHQMMTGDLLRSQTLETACQEVAVMIIGTALVAGERARLEKGEELQTRVSFIKTWQYLEPLWTTLMVAGDLLTQEQKQGMTDRFYWVISQLRTPKKRKRSCPRVLVQPVRGWPRKRGQRSFEGEIQITVIGSARK